MAIEHELYVAEAARFIKPSVMVVRNNVRLNNGRIADLGAITKTGDVIIIEVKTDWRTRYFYEAQHYYMPHCHLLYFALPIDVKHRASCDLLFDWGTAAERDIGVILLADKNTTILKAARRRTIALNLLSAARDAIAPRLTVGERSLGAS